MKNKGAIEALEKVKQGLCPRELTASGREYVDKLIRYYTNDTSRAKNRS